MYLLINFYREDKVSDDLDRYGLYKSNRPAPVIDIFSQLDQTKPEVRNVDEELRRKQEAVQLPHFYRTVSPLTLLLPENTSRYRYSITIATGILVALQHC